MTPPLSHHVTTLSRRVHISAARQGTIVQQRVLSVVPVRVDEEVLAATFRAALRGYE